MLEIAQLLRATRLGGTLVGVALLTGVGAEAASHAWTSATLGGTELAVDVLPPSAPSRESPPLVIYLTRLSEPRVGTESDAAIVQDLRSSGCLVATVDFAGHPDARVPRLHRALGEIRDALHARRLLQDRAYDARRVYLVPSGCRLVRDVVYAREAGRVFAVDIIYPAAPRTPRGVVLEFSCDNRDRFGNGSLSICSDTILDGAASAGHIVVMADHPVPAPYKGIDRMPECAQRIKAAVRTARATTSPLGGNGAIVPVGFSRGSGMALMLATTRGRAEFEGLGEHPGESSDVQGAVVMSGRFTYLDLLPNDLMLPRYARAWGPRDSAAEVWRRHGALDYLAAPAVPLFLTINPAESADALHQMAVLRQRLTALDSAFTYVPEPAPRGHKVPLDEGVLTAMHTYLREQLVTHGD